MSTLEGERITEQHTLRPSDRCQEDLLSTGSAEFTLRPAGFVRRGERKLKLIWKMQHANMIEEATE